MKEESILCPKCGNSNVGNSTFCEKCGSSLIDTRKTTQTPIDIQESPDNVSDERPTSGFAVASLVLGLLDIVIGWIAIIELNAVNSSLSVLGWLLVLVFIIALTAVIMGWIASGKTGYSNFIKAAGAVGLLLGALELALSVISLFGLAIVSCLANNTQ